MANQPNLQSGYDEVCRDVKQFQALAEQLVQTVTEPGRRARVEALLKELQNALVQVQDTFPKAAAWLEQTHAVNMEQARTIQAKAQELRKKIEERKAQVAAEAGQKAPAPAIDPTHGAKLRKEVLERFGKKGPAPAGPKGSGDVADMSSSAWTAKSAEDASEKHGRKTKKSAANKQGGDVTDISSGAWTKDEPQ